ncbi:MAG: 2-oxoisovalerate dehydrogenase [Bacteroidia bacterium]|nr:2-oxoisovalerate dehydrogenase [Bacteroidia bacterium]
MNEIIFLIEPSEEGGFISRALGHGIFTEADTIEELKKMIIDAVKCHFNSEEMPKMIRLHYVKDEVFSIV